MMASSCARWNASRVRKGLFVVVVLRSLSLKEVLYLTVQLRDRDASRYLLCLFFPFLFLEI
ncbi:hypothetical protein HanRHA438_Chr09g0376541 [Helianthus annuus]|nr:hypothetical protein HanRHA438_Chr09g0376541 [Helianthus annuus]